ncbi:hypothetical protein [Acidovorax sp. FG27]|uniref:hypothetical protein n=1 Tax=Acidovorax sp. FG27 TaxID=3133652 RepID=UPI0030E7B348
MQVRVQRRIRSGLAAAALACGCITTHAAPAATGFTPQSGTWIVSAELDGKPGRGLAIDVQDGIVVMQIYNYRADGTATFHLATGQLVNQQMSAPLRYYRGGPYFGSGPLTGVEAGNAGNVQISFTSGSTGIVQFPGEPPVAMERYRFEGLPQDRLATKFWVLALLDDAGNAAEVLTGATGEFDQASETPGAPGLAIGTELGDFNRIAHCSYSPASYSFRCAGNGWNAEFKEYVRQLSGTLTWAGTTYRMVGMRFMDFNNGAADIEAPGLAFTHTPNDGTWVVSSELNGKPGRGMAIDTQGGTLVMQVYNYDTAGDATFHMAMGPYQNTQAGGPLKRYQGGRWFGSSARSGTEAADAGMVYLAFDNPNKGVVRFPGEGPRTIERFRFGASPPDPASLLGTWALYDRTNGLTTTLTLNSVYGPSAQSVDGMVCSYSDAAARKVRCLQRVRDSTLGNYKLAKDYRFVLNGDMAWGKAMLKNAAVPIGEVPSDADIKDGTLYGIRVVDRHGMQTGLGPLR